MFATTQQITEDLIFKKSEVPVNIPDCHTRIAEIAYYKAECRGFEPGRT